ncbi:MAG: winged helix-turn-helix domain-containing protein [Thermoanaerobaculales bacterium]|nr:winged helix-turn-helix domain-containing protein [Thermoanaerobaculales bacterium]
MPPQQGDARDFRLGEWLVQPSLGRVSGPAGEAHLEPRTMELLVFLAAHAGRVVSRQEIIDAVWRLEFVSDATLSSAVTKLRRALDDDTASPRFIETIAKRGYRLLQQPVDVLDLASRPGGAFRVGDWLVEPSLNRMTNAHNTVQLDRSAMDVLLCLAERAGEAVPPSELIDRVWRTETVSELTVSTRIAELRAALGSGAGGNPGVIEAVPEGGYRLAAPIGFAEPRATVTPFPRAPAALAEPERDPYPGLAAFTAADAANFVGREAETAEMWRRISSRRLLAVAGPSGVGKSSFIAAGVIPAAPPGWASLVCTPGEAPFLCLARSLAREVAGDPDQVERLLAFDDPEAAVAVVSVWRERFGDALLIVDQLEELFTLNPPEVRSRFVGLLARLAGEAGVHVVLVLRDDFLHECQAHPELAPIFRDLTMLGPPTAHDLRRALVEPARRRGVGFSDDELADDMVAAVAGERGALPLLAFAARRLWELRDRERRLVTREAYERIGGVAGALAQHAEATLEAIGTERLPLVRELFRNLVTAQQTRATRSVDDLLSVFDEGRRDEAAKVLQALVDARLLTSFEEEPAGEGETEGPRRVEIVHESLLREWPRLVRWQTQDADAAQLRDQLRQAAQLWQARGRPVELLWSGTPYREFRVWCERYPGGLSDAERAFADAMVAHAGRRRRRRRLAAAAVLLAALAVATATTALWWRSELNAHRLEAQTLIERARQLMDRSPPTAFAHALASLEVVDSPEARQLVLEALWRSPMPMVIDRKHGLVSHTGVSLSPDGRRLVTGHFDGHLVLWSETGGPPRIWRAHEDRARAHFTSDSTALISGATTEPHLIVWSVPEARRLGEQPIAWGNRTDIDARHANILRRLWQRRPDPSAPGGWRTDDSVVVLVERLAEGRLPAAALSPDGSQLVYALDEALYRIAVDGPGTPTLLGRTPSTVDLIEFHPAGNRLATVHTDGTMRLWSMHNGTVEMLRTWPRARDGYCDDLLFDPSGSVLAVAFDDGRAVVRAVDEPPAADPLVLSPFGGRMIELAFHPKGSWLATADTILVSMWPLDRSRYPTVLRGHTGKVEEVAFAPDGSWLASLGVDGTVRLWPLRFSPGAGPRILDDWGHAIEGGIGSLAVSPDGSFVVSTAGEDTARLVPIDGSPPRILGGFDQRVLDAAVGPGGRQVAVPGRLGGRMIVRVWDLETGATRDVDLGDPRDWHAIFIRVKFQADGHLLVEHMDRLMRVDPITGRRTTVAGDVREFGVDGRGEMVLSCLGEVAVTRSATVHDLVAGTHSTLARHGAEVSCVALDPRGRVAVTGGYDGIVRIGPVTGEEPHWLVGHTASVSSVAVSPDGRFIASGGRDGTIRIWPMPDLTKPPLQALARAELIARLKTLTNLRVVRDPDVPGSHLVQTEPFPGWQTAPEW